MPKLDTQRTKLFQSVSATLRKLATELDEYAAERSSRTAKSSNIWTAEEMTRFENNLGLPIEELRTLMKPKTSKDVNHRYGVYVQAGRVDGVDSLALKRKHSDDAVSTKSVNANSTANSSASSKKSKKVAGATVQTTLPVTPKPSQTTSKLTQKPQEKRPAPLSVGDSDDDEDEEDDEESGSAEEE